MRKYLGIGLLLLGLSFAGAGLPNRTEARPGKNQPSALETSVEEKRPYQYDKNDGFRSDSEPNIVARLLYGEARGETSNPDYIFGVLSTLKNRAVGRGKSLKETALESAIRTIRDKDKKVINRVREWHYSCFEPNNPNYKIITDPLRYNYRKTWEKCYGLAVQFAEGKLKLSNDVQKKLGAATDYWVDTEEAPYWAYKTIRVRKNPKDSKSDIVNKKVLREPLVVVPVLNGMHKAYFYKLK